MWEVERGDEEPDTLALHPITIEVICDHPGYKVFASAGPAVEGQGQWLVGLWVVDKTLDGFQHHRLSQVLPMKLCLKVMRQTCTVQSTRLGGKNKMLQFSSLKELFMTIIHSV